MIYTLSISNIALIDNLNIRFSKGLNVLTGETGAGKSIIVDSMNLALGERADRELIRTGKSGAKVEAAFYIGENIIGDLFEKYGINEADELIVSRELSTDGRNSCRINGAMVNLGTLKEFTDRMVDLHGQHEHQYLLQSKTHIEFLDNFSEKEILPIKNEIGALVREHRRLAAERDSIGGTPEERARSADLFRYEINEIKTASIKIGEEDALREERVAAVNAEKISETLAECHRALYARQDSLLAEIGRIQKSLEAISDYSSAYKALADGMGESYYALEDLAEEAQRECERVFFDANRVAEIEERLDLIFAMKRKYGGSEQAVLAYLEEAEASLEKLEDSDHLLSEIQEKLHVVHEKLYELYKNLSQKRREAGGKLEELIEAELSDLGMGASKFKIYFEDLPSFEKMKYADNGIDKIEFTISTNAGEPLKPLSKIVSGGEVSRIMLAFKNVFARTDKIGTLIFDEIDTGISGNMAYVVAEKLSKIARDKQVICVSHLPQIAAIADANYLISKREINGKTLTEVALLDEKGKIAEVSRLSGGTDSENALGHAREMIKKADEVKNKQ
jgi:DNA repair protein RecN (Recombination protein N)